MFKTSESSLGAAAADCLGPLHCCSDDNCQLCARPHPTGHLLCIDFFCVCLHVGLCGWQDTFGSILEVPGDKYWGAHWQTQRSLQNFNIGGALAVMPVEVIRGFGVLKKCAAKVHMAHGDLDPRRGDAILRAAQELIHGDLDAHFPLVCCCLSLN